MQKSSLVTVICAALLLGVIPAFADPLPPPPQGDGSTFTPPYVSAHFDHEAFSDGTVLTAASADGSADASSGALRLKAAASSQNPAGAVMGPLGLASASSVAHVTLPSFSSSTGAVVGVARLVGRVDVHASALVGQSGASVVANGFWGPTLVICPLPPQPVVFPGPPCSSYRGPDRTLASVSSATLQGAKDSGNSGVFTVVFRSQTSNCHPYATSPVIEVRAGATADGVADAMASAALTVESVTMSEAQCVLPPTPLPPPTPKPTSGPCVLGVNCPPPTPRPSMRPTPSPTP